MIKRRFPFIGSCNPTPIYNYSCRGLTLLEVLISLGIITFGLLSLSALFVVGAYNMREAEIQERSRIVAEEAFNDIIAYRMLSTPKWVMYNEEDGMFNQSLVETMQYLHMTDQKHKMEEEIGSVFVLDPIGAASVNFNHPKPQSINYGSPKVMQ